jgi:DNA-binding HxlR family transcriptional regulator
MPHDDKIFAAGCASRMVIDQIADKWSVLILAALCGQALRFNELRRRLEGVTQKALTQALRRLERNGIVSRQVLDVSPVAVEYRVTALGKSLQKPFAALHAWSVDHLGEVQRAQEAFDRRAAQRPRRA